MGDLILDILDRSNHVHAAPSSGTRTDTLSIGTTEALLDPGVEMAIPPAGDLQAGSADYPNHYEDLLDPLSAQDVDSVENHPSESSGQKTAPGKESGDKPVRKSWADQDSDSDGPSHTHPCSTSPRSLDMAQVAPEVDTVIMNILELDISDLRMHNLANQLGSTLWQNEGMSSRVRRLFEFVSGSRHSTAERQQFS